MLLVDWKARLSMSPADYAKYLAARRKAMAAAVMLAAIVTTTIGAQARTYYTEKPFHTRNSAHKQRKPKLPKSSMTFRIRFASNGTATTTYTVTKTFALSSNPFTFATPQP